MLRRLVAEAVGTFFLVFCGTGAIVVDSASGGMVTHLGIAITFGLVVMCMIFVFGDVSGAHFNPAVTIAFALSRRFAFSGVVPYVVSQLFGAGFASLILRALFPGAVTFGATVPAAGALQSLILEIIISMALMLVIFSVSTGSREKGLFAGIAIGGAVALAAIFAGPISGASMNPARSFGPALVAMNPDSLWIYFLGPCVGTSLAAFLTMFLESRS
ncbi:MAG: aquaporin [Spirochaetales bacterium]|nr:aquaporin [Leptospiraceae bacterium]MCP5483819.1 aquaporin [Spirochaetales bacterium]